MIERGDERFIPGVDEHRHELLDRGAGIRDPLASHAVAGIEKNTQADRHALVGKHRDRLRRAILEDLEIVFGETGDEPTGGVGHSDIHLNRVDRGPEGLRDKARAGKQTEHQRHRSHAPLSHLVHEPHATEGRPARLRGTASAGPPSPLAEVERSAPTLLRLHSSPAATAP